MSQYCIHVKYSDNSCETWGPYSSYGEALDSFMTVQQYIEKKYFDIACHRIELGKLVCKGEVDKYENIPVEWNICEIISSALAKVWYKNV